jgi:CBS domain-containing protein
MAQQIRDVMSRDLVTLPADATVIEASQAMQQRDIGDVLVTDEDRLIGVLTDRDIVVRAIAEGHDPTQARIGDFVTMDLATLTPDAEVTEAVAMMRDTAVRRVPVVEDDRPVGIVSIGDLAIEHDDGSALADISSAEPNN